MSSPAGRARAPTQPRRSSAAAPPTRSQETRVSHEVAVHKVVHCALHGQDMQKLRACYDLWQAYVRQRQLGTHLKRCAVALKHSANRQQYARMFLRWLAVAQQHASSDARASFTLPKDVPLRSKKDVLALVSRYFHKWRRSLREKKQRTHANVELLSKLNTERLRYKTFLRWTQAQQQRREDLYRARFLEAEEHLDALTAKLERAVQEKKALGGELHLLQGAMGKAVVELNGNPRGVQLHAAPSESREERLRTSEELAEALKEALVETASALPAGAAGQPICARLRAMEGTMEDAEAEHQKALHTIEDLNKLVSALTQMLESERNPELVSPPVMSSARGLGSSNASFAAANTRYGRLNSSPANSSIDGGTPVRASPSPSQALAASMNSQRSRATTSMSPSPASDSRRAPKASQTLAESPSAVSRATAARTAKKLADGGNTASPRLLEEVSLLVDAARQSKKALSSREDEVATLRDAVTRAVDCFGGRGATVKGQPGTQTDETPEESASRSSTIANGLREICEDMVVVLVLTSLWSNGGASEKVSESLERMWHQLQESKEETASLAETAQQVMDVVGGAAHLLGGELPSTQADGRQLLGRARESAKVLKTTKKQELPLLLLDRCDATRSARDSAVEHAHALEKQDKELEKEREQLLAELDATRETLSSAEKQLREKDASAATASKQQQELSRELDAAETKLQASAKELQDLESREEDTQRELESARRQLEELLASQEDARKAMSEIQQACHNAAALLGDSFTESTHSDTNSAAVTDNGSATVDLVLVGALTAARGCATAATRLRRMAKHNLDDLPQEVSEQLQRTLGTDASAADLIEALAAWKDTLLDDMRDALTVNMNQEALATFLRDVLRDVIHRLVQAREGGEDEDSMLSTRVSLALDPEEHPRPLVRGDPSQYVEYILGLEGIDEQGKRAVQDHLTGSSSVGDAASPSTWDVIADLHENLAALAHLSLQQTDTLVEQREAMEVLTRSNGALRESLDAAQHSLQRWSEARVSADERTPSASLSSTQRDSGGSLVGGLMSQVDSVVEALRQLREIAEEDLHSLVPVSFNGQGIGGSEITDLPTLVKTIQSMQQRLVELQETAENGIAALGGDGDAGDEAEPSDGVDSEHPSHTPSEGLAGSRGHGPLNVTVRLANICRDTGESIQAAKEMLGVSGQDGPLKLKDVLPGIRAKIAELEELRKDSDAFIKGLDNAFADDSVSSLNSSFTSSSKKSLKAKKKPLPALEGSPSELMTMTHRNFLSKHPSSPGGAGGAVDVTPQERLTNMRRHALGKIDEVQDLRTACRAAINVLDGSFVEGRKAPSYGDILVPLLLSQIEDVKKSLPLCNSALSKTRGGTNTERQNGVGAKLATLASMVTSQQIERENLHDELDGKSRQNKILLDDFNHHSAHYKREEGRARERESAFQQEIAGMKDSLDAARREIDDLTRQIAALQSKDTAATQQLEEASQRHENFEDNIVRLQEAVEELSAAIDRERTENDILTKQLAQRQHEKNVLNSGLARALVALQPPSLEPSEARAGLQADEADERYADQRTDEEERKTVAEMESALLQQLSNAEGEALVQYVLGQVHYIRQHWERAVAGHGALEDRLQKDLAALRDELAHVWERKYRSICEDMVAQASEESARLHIENDLLRPRAIEREALLKENRALQRQLEGARASLATAENEVDTVMEANMQLTQALQEAKVEQVIRSIPDGTDGTAASAARKQQLLPAPDVSELERRMIRGATSLTVDAIRSIAGDHMAQTLGEVTTDTVGLYHDVQQCIRGMHHASLTFKRSGNHSSFASAVDKSLAQLEQLSRAADSLWKQVPALFQPPYTSER